MAASNIKGSHIACMAYIEGGALIGKAELTPPEIAFKKIEVTGPGGKFTYAGRQLENMEASFKLTIPNKDALSKLMDPTRATRLSFRGRFQVFDPTSSAALGITDRCDILCSPGSFIPANRKDGENAEQEYKMNVLNVAYWIDGVEVLYADPVNIICRINGVDKFSGDRTALGIG